LFVDVSAHPVGPFWLSWTVGKHRPTNTS